MAMETTRAAADVPVTASMLYDLVSCPHRVAMDLFADPSARAAPNAFVQLLWERGSAFEKQVVEALDAPFTDLSALADHDRERLTVAAMQRGDALIYGGRLRVADLLGDPDLLRKEDGGYVAGDVKSGSGEEGSEDRTRLKKHYAVQLALYTDALERQGFSAGRRAFVWDGDGKEVVYDFEQLQGRRNPRTFWQDYQACLAEARAIVGKTGKTLPAYGSLCKLCHWHEACTSSLAGADDLTLIPELGRARRDVLAARFPTVRALAAADPADFVVGNKTVFPGIGPATLEKFHARARLLTAGDAARPYLRAPVTLPATAGDLFFDVETDPMRDVCYLHGFVERRGNETERFVAFFADEPTAAAERRAFEAAWRYLRERESCAVYYYSKYERTVYRKLRGKYPDACTEEELEALFGPARAVDLYDVVLQATEWPTRDLSIKTLAGYLGFAWRDPNPSGAASIEWFHRWVETGDPAIRQRILEYNEDDCRAMRVLRDAIGGLDLMADGDEMTR